MTFSQDVGTPSKRKKLGKHEIIIAGIDALSSALQKMNLETARQTKEVERDRAADTKRNNCSL